MVVHALDRHILCLFCHKPFIPKKKWHKHCSPACGYETRRARYADLTSRVLAKLARCEHGPCLYCCWEWQGTRQERGYGHLSWQNSTLGIHRVMYAAWHGIEIPADKQVCHHCDNPPCGNPWHLFLGSQRENNRDKIRKRRHRFGDSHPATKIPTAQLDALRQMLLTGATERATATQFEVSKSLVHAIRRGKIRQLG